MKKQRDMTDYEAIVQTFRDLGLDAPELRHRLQEFSKPGGRPARTTKYRFAFSTRNNTARLHAYLYGNAGVQDH